ncbi:PepSY-associated TM helix domain-containing protein [Hyphococcus sp. DH-69]|uniref:PepSY-associated TM helix domain-containing protein n=1 Tax=Hyphococcus formosus TaxID=3143534 RepID=UPI00398ACAC3
MPANQPPARSGFKPTAVKIHRWLSIGAAAFWLIQALTGIILTFHFEIEDAVHAPKHYPTDLQAIENRMESLASSGPEATVHWIWTSAGLPDRYVISFAGADGENRNMRIDGNANIMRDRPASDLTFLGFIREIHLTLLSGSIGHWILAFSGVLLISNLILGLITAWPRRGTWRHALKPHGSGTATAQIYSWHRALGLWIFIPAFFVVGAGTLILFEHEIAHVLDAEDISLPANPPTGTGVGFAAAAQAAVDAIPGSRFVGTTLPSPEDASYYAWVRAPGELYRGGYGASLVIVDANDATIRGAYPATDLDAGSAFVKSFYPIHTGEFAGLPGRIFAMMVGIWLAAMTILGIVLWLRRRKV